MFLPCMWGAGVTRAFLNAQDDWTTGVLQNGNSWRTFCAVVRSHPFRPLVLYFWKFCFNGVETEGLLDYQGRAAIMSIVL